MEGRLSAAFFVDRLGVAGPVLLVNGLGPTVGAADGDITVFDHTIAVLDGDRRATVTMNYCGVFSARRCRDAQQCGAGSPSKNKVPHRLAPEFNSGQQRRATEKRST
jgi:hypothetical protein